MVFSNGLSWALSRRLRALCALLLGGVIASMPALAAAADALPLARDLRADARSGRPVVVLFAAQDCPYCHRVEDDYLVPLMAQREYAGKVLFRIVRTDDARALRDFNGGVTSHDAFAAREHVGFTPVIRFFGAGGRRLAADIVGLGTPDFFAGEIERALDTAIAAARTAAPVRARLNPAPASSL